ncbi:hypothetical protein LZ31DRAFT_339868 [Colletotrichum somersetense]|nr:hypothetical protein LZ31DRAFT_339868 [Colletotrichum somersetense]
MVGAEKLGTLGRGGRRRELELSRSFWEPSLFVCLPLDRNTTAICPHSACDSEETATSGAHYYVGSIVPSIERLLSSKMDALSAAQRGAMGGTDDNPGWPLDERIQPDLGASSRDGWCVCVCVCVCVPSHPPGRDDELNPSVHIQALCFTRRAPELADEGRG